MTAELEWIKLYRAALRETDPDKQPARVEEAKRAMKQALRMAVEYEDSDQRHSEQQQNIRHGTHNGNRIAAKLLLFSDHSSLFGNRNKSRFGENSECL